MNNLSLLEQLDALLSFLITGIDNNNVISYFNSNNNEFNELLEKLAKDGFIMRTKDQNNKNHDINMPTIDGRIFLLNGGYKNKFLTDKNDALLTQFEIDRQKTLDVHSEQNQIRLNHLTFWLAIGTGTLSLIELAKILQPAFQYYCNCHFVWEK